ncbi:MAG: TlpA family protein disulfide reductase [Planctomycetota bacterium]|jgi:thiol-disulfide isomerase/thioredoxin
MRKTGILLLVCLAVPAAAQETAAPDSAAAWEKLDRQFKTDERKFYKPWKDAKANGEEYGLDYTQHPNRTFMPRFVAFAKEHRGSEEAVKALIHVMRYTPDKEERNAAVATLLEDHVESQAIRPAIGTLRTRAPETLDTLIEKTPHRDIKGFAMLARAKSLKGKDDARALRMLEKLQKNYFDVIERGTTLADRAEREIFEIVNLAVGKPAPEIEGEDLAGESFKLSDYRGKVVMLDFWGDW